ncbi:MAG: DsrE family protein [Algoriphagus sp.]|uniref:DsrE family protein n=1 Tax=Algoriphagus sp. TaxID=1872435 RepID=UPI00272FFD16|nr:DsrE family protein [Algoriphagus sp.]MDP2042701.1 DsrE family protein [Algoriphagus sp.]MDP3473238.1 DsrE family protein [Algoriphagus sp.]
MKIYPLICLACMLSLHVFSQQSPVKIVFDVTSADPMVHEATLRHVTEMSKSYPDSKFQVVMYGGSVDLVNAEKSTVSNEVKALASNKNVAFVVCEQTLKRKNIPVSQLFPGVILVPDGILEIVQKQQQGWGYIKEGN